MAWSRVSSPPEIFTDKHCSPAWATRDPAMTSRRDRRLRHRPLAMRPGPISNGFIGVLCRGLLLQCTVGGPGQATPPARLFDRPFRRDAGDDLYAGRGLADPAQGRLPAAAGIARLDAPWLTAVLQEAGIDSGGEAHAFIPAPMSATGQIGRASVSLTMSARQRRTRPHPWWANLPAPVVGRSRA